MSTPLSYKMESGEAEKIGRKREIFTHETIRTAILAKNSLGAPKHFGKTQATKRQGRKPFRISFSRGFILLDGVFYILEAGTAAGGTCPPPAFFLIYRDDTGKIYFSRI